MSHTLFSRYLTRLCSPVFLLQSTGCLSLSFLVAENQSWCKSHTLHPDAESCMHQVHTVTLRSVIRYPLFLLV